MTLLCLVLRCFFCFLICIFVSNIFQLAFFNPNWIICVFLLLSNNICLLSTVLEHVCRWAGISVRHYCEVYSVFIFYFVLVQPASESYHDSYQELPFSYSHIFCMRPFQHNNVISKGLKRVWVGSEPWVVLYLSFSLSSISSPYSRFCSSLSPSLFPSFLHMPLFTCIWSVTGFNCSFIHCV